MGAIRSEIYIGFNAYGMLKYFNHILTNSERDNLIEYGMNNSLFLTFRNCHFRTATSRK